MIDTVAAIETVGIKKYDRVPIEAPRMWLSQSCLTLGAPWVFPRVSELATTDAISKHEPNSQ